MSFKKLLATTRLLKGQSTVTDAPSFIKETLEASPSAKQKMSLGEHLTILLTAKDSSESIDGASLLDDFCTMLDEDTMKRMQEEPPLVYIRLGSVADPKGYMIPSKDSLIANFAQLCNKIVSFGKKPSVKVLSLTQTKNAAANSLSKDVDKFASKIIKKVATLTAKTKFKLDNESENVGLGVEVLLSIFTSNEVRKEIYAHIFNERMKAEKVWKEVMFVVNPDSENKESESIEEKKKSKKVHNKAREEKIQVDSKGEVEEIEKEKETDIVIPEYALRKWTPLDDYEALMFTFNSTEVNKVSNTSDLVRDFKTRIVIKNVPEDVVDSLTATLFSTFGKF